MRCLIWIITTNNIKSTQKWWHKNNFPPTQSIVSNSLRLVLFLILISYLIYLLPQISEKQKSLYEALERQQHYQESLQSISTKMESIEGALNEGLEPSKTPESQMAAHQVRKKYLAH